MNGIDYSESIDALVRRWNKILAKNGVKTCNTK
jgi:hypothetical protein